MNILLIPIFLPLFTAIFILLVSEKTKYLKEVAAIMASFISFLSALTIFLSSNIIAYSLPWAGYSFDFTLKADVLGKLALLFATGVSFLAAFYAAGFMKKRTDSAKWFFFNLLFTGSFSSGAVLSDNLLTMLFFWEGLVIFLYTFLVFAKGGRNSGAIAMKAFIINAVANLCFLIGITITGFIAGSMNMTEIHAGKLAVSGWAFAAYLLLLIGIVSKIEGMPFHTWMTDAGADGANSTFLAYVPGALDKILGIYMLVRVSIYLYVLNGVVQALIMTLGVVVLLFAAMMALAQKNYKKLLAYIAVSQSGYALLGVGTMNATGIAGGLFYALNNAIYLFALFLTAGSVESQSETSNMAKLGGLWKRMPATTLVFIIAALSISSVPPFNGFFSKEILQRGILEAGYPMFFAAVELGSIITLIALLKLGHSVYFAKETETSLRCKESGMFMIIPMFIAAILCLFFGFGAKIPVEHFLEPVLRYLALEHARTIAGFQMGNLLLISVAGIIVSIISHVVGYGITGKPYKATDYLLYAPVLSKIYRMAEHKVFDPYEQIMKSSVWPLGQFFSKLDSLTDYLTFTLPSFVSNSLSKMSQKFHRGSYVLYMTITIIGFLVYMAYVFSFGGIK